MIITDTMMITIDIIIMMIMTDIMMITIDIIIIP